MISEIFSKDRKVWTSENVQSVQMFFKCNQFFSKFYDFVYFEDIVNMTYYVRVSPDLPLLLTDNKRSSAIILLKGNIKVEKKEVDAKRARKRGRNDEFKLFGEYIGYNETIQLFSQARVSSLHGQTSQILFIPSYLYNAFTSKREEESTEVTYSLLNKVFKDAERRPLLELAKSGCTLQSVRINNYVYREGEKPDSVYIILEGSMKMERPGFSNKANDIVVVSTESIVGDKDICLPQRQTSLRCCSASGRLLRIPKHAFIRFAKLCLPYMKFETQGRRKSSHKNSLDKDQRKLRFPMIMRFHSGRRSKEEQEQEYRLIKNSHILLEASPPSKTNKIRSRSSISQVPKDIMVEKIKLYKKLRPVESKVDLANRIV